MIQVLVKDLKMINVRLKFYHCTILLCMIYVQLKYSCSMIDMQLYWMLIMITVLLTYDTCMIGNTQVLRQDHVSTGTFRHIPPHTYQPNHTVLPLGLLSLCTHQVVGFSFPENLHMDVLQPKSSMLYCLILIQHLFSFNSNATPSHPKMSNKFHLLGLF